MRRHAGWDRMRRPRACLARHAPGRRRGSAWRPIGDPARSWLTEAVTLRTATKSAARRSKENAANKPGRAQACPGGAPSGAPYFREGIRAHKEQWLRPLARHPPHLEGRQWEDGPTRGLAKQYG